MAALAVIFSPRAFFREMPRSDGYGGPMFFMIMMVVVSIFETAILSSLGLGFGGGMGAGMPEATGPGAMLGKAMIVGVSVVAVPVGVAIASFVWSGVLYLIWKLLGSDADFMTAYCCTAYLTSLFPVTTALGFIPFIGSALGIASMVIYTVIATVEVHEVHYVKAWLVFGVLGTALLLVAAKAEYYAFSLVEGAVEARQKAESDGLLAQARQKAERIQAAQAAQAAASLGDTSDAEFEADVLRSRIPVVVEFWAPDNPACQATDPGLASLAREFAGRYRFLRINSQENPWTTNQYSVGAIPTLLLFENGAVTKKNSGGGTESVVRGELGLPGGYARTDASRRTIAANLTYTTDEDFEKDVTNSSTPVILEVCASLSPDCARLDPEVVRLAAMLDGRVKVVKVDVEANYKTREEYRTDVYPTLFLIVNGRTVKSQYGASTAEEMMQKFGL